MFIVDEVILNIHSTYYWHYKYLATSFHSVLVQLLNQIHDPRLALRLSTVQSLPRQVVSMMMIQSTELLFAFHRHPSIDLVAFGMVIVIIVVALWLNQCDTLYYNSVSEACDSDSTHRNHHLEIISQTRVSHDYHSTVKSPPRSSLYFVVCRKSFNR